MCDKSNAEEIVAEMLDYLKIADYAIREEMVSFLPRLLCLLKLLELAFHCISTIALLSAGCTKENKYVLVFILLVSRF